jgi:hypothetical protein
MSEKPKLPVIDVWDPEYIRRALLLDHCSCAPDNIPTPWGNVYVGHLCKRHDDRYAWIWRQGRGPGFRGLRGFLRGWWLRLRLKWASDRELGAGIKEAFHREGIHARFIPLAYREFVIMLNFPFRLFKAIWKAVWNAVFFRD